MRKKKKRPRFSRTQFWENWRHEALYSMPILLGLAIIVLFPSPWGVISGIFVSGFAGIIIIHQRNASSAFVTIKGTPAVIIGVLVVAFLWGGALLVTLAYLFHW